MEIEAWFLAESTHLVRLDSRLTPDKILSEVGIDLRRDDLERRQKPSEDLNNILSLVDMAYEKSRNQVQSVVDALDFESLYIDIPGRMPSLRPLIEGLESFLN